jgi:formate C-acetyltransferase
MQTTPHPNEENRFGSHANQLPYSDRIARMKNDLLSSCYEADIERARYYTRAYKETEDLLPAVRAAKGLEKTLRHMSIKIDHDEWLAGAKTIKKVAGPIGIERSLSSLMSFVGVQFQGKDVDAIRFMDKVGGNSPEFLKGYLNLPDEMVHEFSTEILPYWEGKDLHSRMVDLWRKEGVLRDGEPTKGPVGAGGMQGHVTVGLKKVLDMGFSGIALQAKTRLDGLKKDDPLYEKQKDFLEAVQISAHAVHAHANRYADLADQMAGTASEKRKKELQEIAQRCRRVPEYPARNFMEALQSIWMTQITTVISYGEDSIFSPGRVDQLLHPYYQKDVQEGLLTRGRAIEILEEYLIKLSTFIAFGANNITIGGIGKNGESAVNEVSYLFLEAHENIKGLRNGLAVRISEKTPRAFLKKAVETHRRTAGVAFFNDAVIIKDLNEDGYPLQDARDYSIVGCVEPTGTGNNNGYTASNSIRLSAILEMALHEGRQFGADWQQMGSKTPPADTFESIEDVKKAFENQLKYNMDLMVKRADIKDQLFADAYPAPLLSSTIEGCVESGLDLTSGGAKYNHGGVSARALATVANSLAAVQWAVFEEKLVTMGELVEHLKNNFKDAEVLRQKIIHYAPKYGNADPKVDDLAVWVAKVYSEEARKHPCILGGVYRPLLVASGTHVYEGRETGATPDGRLARQPVSNGISPANGTEKNGMTSVLQSVCAVSAIPMPDGTGMNMNFNPAMIQSEEGLDKFTALLEAYFEMGGRHIQFNPYSRETLIDAQQNPKNYPDLMVKVSGYSYRYIDLSKALQDDILTRTEFSF